MPSIGLLETLTQKDSILNSHDAASNRLKLPDHRAYIYSPGFMVILAAFAKKVGTDEGGINYPAQRYEDYAEAVGLPKAVWGKDTYEQVRVNEGKNYSSLVHLDDEDATDKASETVNNCIRQFFPGGVHDDFVKELCDLVGDLHSNVC